MVRIGDVLGILVTSQKRQLELGVRKSVELFDLVKRYYQRWNLLKTRVEKRHADIESAMVKYDPANLGVAGEWVGLHDWHVTEWVGGLLQLLSLLPSFPPPSSPHCLPYLSIPLLSPSHSIRLASRMDQTQGRAQYSILCQVSKIAHYVK